MSIEVNFPLKEKMSFRADHFAARRYGWLGLMLLCLRVMAQQAIQFSTPAEDPANQEIAFAPKPPHKINSYFTAPKPLFPFGSQPSFDVLPRGPEPVIVTALSPQWQKNREASQNWTLMTPEQILGVPTPESIMGLPDPEEDSSLSLEERFLKRRERQAETASGATNLWQPVLRGKEGLQSGPFDDSQAGIRFAETFEHSPSSFPMVGATRDLPHLFGQNSGVENSQPDPLWRSPFESQEAPAKATPEQLAGMERFDKILMTPTAPAAATTPVMANVTSDPFMQAQPAYNPAGHAVDALASGIAKPTGLTPLPGVTGPAPAPAKKTAWVQPPPWLSSEHASLPQRQY